MKKVETRAVNIGNVVVGGSQFVVIAGPCSIESRDQFLNTAMHVKKMGATILRGGMFKMRTHSETFQGLKTAAAPLVQEIKQLTGMPFVSEITDPRQIDFLHDFVDAFQVGSRNMYNYELLKELGKTKKPVLLKRAFSAFVDEWIGASEYIASGGNENIIMCERGIRSFDKVTRNILDLSSAAIVQMETPFPVLIDPSHATGRPDLIPAMSRAAVAVGADGIMIEVHPEPKEALSDGFQALTFEAFSSLMDQINPFVSAAGKTL